MDVDGRECLIPGGRQRRLLHDDWSAKAASKPAQTRCDATGWAGHGRAWRTAQMHGTGHHRLAQVQALRGKATAHSSLSLTVQEMACTAATQVFR